MAENPRSRQIVASLALVVACLLFGVAIALMAIALLSSEPVSGWAGLTDDLGGLFVGGLLGVIAGIYLARDLSVTALWWASAVAVLLTAGTLWSLALAT